MSSRAMISAVPSRAYGTAPIPRGRHLFRKEERRVVCSQSAASSPYLSSRFRVLCRAPNSSARVNPGQSVTSPTLIKGHFDVQFIASEDTDPILLDKRGAISEKRGLHWRC